MSDSPGSPESAVGTDSPRRWRIPPLRWLLVGALAIVALAWIAKGVADAVTDIDLERIDHPYAIVFGFVTLDAVVPVFPSESLLNTGSVLATKEGSTLEIWRLIVAGGLGAIVGDSILYWISRTVLRSFMEDRVVEAQRNEKVAETLAILRGQTPMLIVFGRFVPGVRFVVGALMGLTRYSYPRFLLWDVVGSLSWAGFSCVTSALVATTLGGQPVVSLIVSAAITTALLGVMYQRMKRAWEQQRDAVPA